MKLTRIFDFPIQSRRQTSREAENRLTKSGRRQRQIDAVLRVIDASPCPLTVWEIAKQLGVTRQDVAPRVCDLRTLGLIRECPKRKCNVTKKAALTWEAE